MNMKDIRALEHGQRYLARRQQQGRSAHPPSDLADHSAEA
jgi:hypothetical protein